MAGGGSLIMPFENNVGLHKGSSMIYEVGTLKQSKANLVDNNDLY